MILSLHARHICRDPAIEVEILGGIARFENETAVFQPFVRLAVTTAEAGQAAVMERMQSEVYLFVDGVFQHEVKAPHLPAQVELSTHGLEPGRHTLTVNLRNIEDHVGALTIAFIKEQP